MEQKDSNPGRLPAIYLETTLCIRTTARIASRVASDAPAIESAKLASGRSRRILYMQAWTKD